MKNIPVEFNDEIQRKAWAQYHNNYSFETPVIYHSPTVIAGL